MTDQELRKLKRVELLEIMVDQGKAVAEMREEMHKLQEHLTQLEEELRLKEETIEHLKDKLNLKDEKLNHKDEKLKAKDAEMDKQVRAMSVLYNRLKKKLDAKDQTISDLNGEISQLKETSVEFVKTESMTDAVKELDRIFENARLAANQYVQLAAKQNGGERR